MTLGRTDEDLEKAGGNQAIARALWLRRQHAEIAEYWRKLLDVLEQQKAAGTASPPSDKHIERVKEWLHSALDDEKQCKLVIERHEARIRFQNGLRRWFRWGSTYEPILSEPLLSE